VRLDFPAYLKTSLLLSFFCCSGLIWAAEPQNLQQTREDLESVRSRIDTTTSELADTRRTASHLLQQLKDVEHRLKRVGSRIRQTEAKIRTINADIATEETAVTSGLKQINQLEIQIQQRLIALYKGGEIQVLKMLFSSQSPAELVENYLFLQLLVDNDRGLLTAYRSAVAVNEKRLLHLAQLKKTQEAAFQQQQQDKTALQQASSEKSRLLKKVKSDEVALAELLTELEEKAARLSSLVKKLESAKPRIYTEKPSHFLVQKGRLEWPITGKILTRFGKGIHPELGTEFVSHGIEIEARGSQPIHSVWGGKVVFANAFRGYGNLMILDHGAGYYSLYAQASRLLKKVGANVAKGEIIAYSGFEGGDAVYFEIRQGGSPEDPLTWLRHRQ
jgi:septal ring factor EnvC (AmiA/AmiB activator)